MYFVSDPITVFFLFFRAQNPNASNGTDLGEARSNGIQNGDCQGTSHEGDSSRSETNESRVVENGNKADGNYLERFYRINFFRILVAFIEMFSLDPVLDGEILPKYKRDLVSKLRMLKAELHALQPQSGHCRLEVSIRSLIKYDSVSVSKLV